LLLVTVTTGLDHVQKFRSNLISAAATAFVRSALLANAMTSRNVGIASSERSM
jgi:hypothetical protein